MAIKSENLYEDILCAVNCMDEKEVETFKRYRIESEWNETNYLSILARIANDLEEDIKHSRAEAAGMATIRKTAIKIAKNSRKESLRGAFLDEEKLCVCDGYRAVRFSGAYKDLEIEMAEGNFELSNIFKNAPSEFRGIPVGLPSIQELKAYIKLDRAEQKARGTKPKSIKPCKWDFGEGFPAVNAQYLLDIIMITGSKKAFVSANNPFAPIYFRSDDYSIDAIILPIRKVQQKKSA